jgi:hypothetical protein
VETVAMVEMVLQREREERVVMLEQVVRVRLVVLNMAEDLLGTTSVLLPAYILSEQFR